MKITLDISRRQAELLKSSINYSKSLAINAMNKCATIDKEAAADWALESQEEYYLIKDVEEQINKHIKGDTNEKIR